MKTFRIKNTSYQKWKSSQELVFVPPDFTRVTLILQACTVTLIPLVILFDVPIGDARHGVIDLVLSNVAILLRDEAGASIAADRGRGGSGGITRTIDKRRVVLVGVCRRRTAPVCVIRMRMSVIITVTESRNVV